MKLLQATFAFALALTACRSDSVVETEIEVVLSAGSRLSQDLAADTAVEMLESQAYASEVLRRLSREDAGLFGSVQALQKRISIAPISGGHRVRIGFRFADRAAAGRVVAAYERCLVENWVRAMISDFQVKPVGERRANQPPEPTAMSVTPPAAQESRQP